MRQCTCRSKVGSDIALLNAIMNVLIEEDLYDKRFVETCTKGFEATQGKGFDLYAGVFRPDMRDRPGPDPGDRAAPGFGKARQWLCYTLGITEHTCGVNNVKKIANLQMLLGNMGMECGGVNPLRGQNNVQGACDMGALPNVYSGYQGVALDASKEKFGTAWGAFQLSQKVGLMMPQMMEGLVTKK